MPDGAAAHSQCFMQLHLTWSQSQLSSWLTMPSVVPSSRSARAPPSAPASAPAAGSSDSCSCSSDGPDGSLQSHRLTQLHLTF